LTEERDVADYFEEVVGAGAEAKPAANWVIGELRQAEGRPPAGDVARLVTAVQSGSMNRDQGRQALAELLAGRTYEQAVAGKTQLSDERELARVVDEVIAENPGNAADVRAGKLEAIGPLVGKVMGKTGGKANPKLVSRLLRERLAGS
jgi:aspartyl-tRNA(Asn)/glutamyl-tRNA(Gln) amidotransferase subunit B